MALNLLDVYLQFRALRTRLDKARHAVLLVQQSRVFDGEGMTLDVQPTDKERLKTWALAQLETAVAEADALIALGGTADLRPQIEMKNSPEVARNYELKLEESLMGLFRSLPLDTRGAKVKLLIAPEIEQRIKDDLATVPTLVQMWIVVARKQIEALT